MSQVEVAPRARADVDEIWTYIARRDLRAAERWVRQLSKRFRMLGRQPLIGESVGELCPGLRRIPYGNYVVYYERDGNVVRIRRVVHGARDVSQFWGNFE